MSKQTPNLCVCGEQPTLHNLLGGDLQVICCCGRRGPYGQTKGSAVNPWNRQTAAPDLLEALAEMLALYADHAKYDDNEEQLLHLEARNAIAKAEGKP